MSEAGDQKNGASDLATWESEGGAAVATSAAANAASVEEARDASPFKPLVLQPDIAAGGRDAYHVEELLQYHDARFIENAYHVLLGRAPFDAERTRELDDLRGGRASKVEIIERLLASKEASGRARRVRVEGLPSPLLRRLSRVPVLGYVLRLARALVRLPLLMQHQQQFEIYALAQQQLIADHVNEVLALAAQANAAAVAATAAGSEASDPPSSQSQYDDLVETVAMFSDALLDLSNGHAELQEQVQTQAEQVQAALTNLTGALTAQQQITETIRREQQAATDAQQEFLIQEQHVIVETQKVALAELREELRALAQRQDEARAELSAQVQRLQTLLDAATSAATATRRNFSGQ